MVPAVVSKDSYSFANILVLDVSTQILLKITTKTKTIKKIKKKNPRKKKNKNENSTINVKNMFPNGKYELNPKDENDNED